MADAPPGEAEKLWIMEHAEDTKAPEIIAVTSICGLLSIFIIGLRLLSRYHIGKALGVSDYCILLAWVLYAVFCICFGVTTMMGAGRHYLQVEDPEKLGQTTMATDCHYFFSMAATKLSILALYNAAFPRKKLKWAIIATALLIVAWTLFSVFTTIYACSPIEMKWDSSVESGQCIDIAGANLASEVVNALTGFAILVIPVPLVWSLDKLDIARKRKWLLLFAFAIGGIACIVALVRLGYTQRELPPSDACWDEVDCRILATAELCICLLAACIPTYLPLFDATQGYLYRLSKRKGKQPDKTRVSPSIELQVLRQEARKPTEQD